MEISMRRASIKIISRLFICLTITFGVVPMAHSQNSDARRIEQLMREKEEQQRRMEQMQSERSDLVKEMRRVENLNRKYARELDEVREQMKKKENAFEERLSKLEGVLERRAKETDRRIKMETKDKKPTIQPIDLEDETFDILLKSGDMDPEDQKFREELARAHYNMGNIFFQKGEYHRAVVEYYQSVDLMPYDSEAHYNLAFVSGEFLGDQATALKHYQWYIYLNPNADDADMVREKIIEAKLHLRSEIDSNIDNTEAQGSYNLAR